MKYVSIILRLMAGMSKLALILLLIKYLEPNEYSIFVLIVATIGYAIYPLGLEFYTYSNREMIGSNSIRQAELLSNHTFIIICGYAVFLPLFYLIFLQDLLPKKIALQFYIILVLEHLSQELYRILVALSKTTESAISLFLRQGSWVILLAIGFNGEWVDTKIETVLIFWMAGGLISLAYASIYLMPIILKISVDSIDTKSIIEGLKISWPFLVACIGANGVLVIDKYVIEMTAGAEYLMAYSYYLALSFGLLLIVDAGIVVYMYPKMVQSWKLKNITMLRDLSKQMRVRIVGVSILFSMPLYFVSGPLLDTLGKGNVGQYKQILIYTTAYVVLSAVTLVPHFGLFALKADRWITYTAFINMLVFVVIVVAFGMLEFKDAVPAALVVIAAISFIIKTFGYGFELKKQRLSVGENY